MDGDIVHTWNLTGETATSVYLLGNGTLLCAPCGWIIHPSRRAVIAGGVERVDWDGQVLWKYEIASERFHAHHDIASPAQWQMFWS